MVIIITEFRGHIISSSKITISTIKIITNKKRSETRIKKGLSKGKNNGMYGKEPWNKGKKNKKK